MKKKNVDVLYFPHDSNARRDPKIIALIADHGYEGYGRFWALIEMMREQKGCLHTDKKTMRAVAYELRMQTEEAEAFIKCLIEDYELLILENEQVHSNRLNKSIALLEEARENAQKAAEARWGKKRAEAENADASKNDASAQENNADASKNECDSNANLPFFDASKVKESKVNINTTVVAVEAPEPPKPIPKTDMDELLKIYFRCFSKPPNIADEMTLLNFAVEKPIEEIEAAFYRGRELKGDKVTLAYIRGVLYKTGIRKIEEINKNGSDNADKSSFKSRLGYKHDQESYDERGEKLNQHFRSRS